jgi:triacylglycerol lipase
MIKRITRILIAIQLAAAIGLLIAAIKFWHVQSVWWGLLLAIGAVMLVRMLINANNFFMSWVYRSQTPPHLQLNWRQACMLFKDEFKASMLTSTWTMPFHAFSKHLAQHSATLPVLLVHGYGCNSGYWKQMSKALAQANITHYAVDLEPVLGSIDAYADALHSAITLLRSETGYQKIIIVAHSMGGLAARTYVRKYGTECIAKIITLGTPHHGTYLANFGMGINSQQMRWHDAEHNIDNKWIRQLADSEDPAIRRLFVSVYSHHDNIIAPQTSAYLPDAKNIELHGIGHVALALNSQVQQIVIDEVRLASHITPSQSALSS